MKKTVAFIFFIFLSVLFVKGQDILEKEGIYYQNGKRYTGVLTEYYSNGQVKTMLNLRKGLKNGEVKIFSEKGRLVEIRSFKNNEMHGKWVVFNGEGMKTSLAGYKNGQKHGKWMIWNDKGILIYVLFYSNGQKTGTWLSYDEEGNLKNKRKY